MRNAGPSMLRYVVPEQKYHCSVCNAPFLTRVGLREHEKGHNAEAEPTQQIKPVRRYRLPKKAKQVA